MYKKERFKQKHENFRNQQITDTHAPPLPPSSSASHTYIRTHTLTHGNLDTQKNKCSKDPYSPDLQNYFAVISHTSSIIAKVRATTDHFTTE